MKIDVFIFFKVAQRKMDDIIKWTKKEIKCKWKMESYVG
jgi:hypothetical protein